MAEITYLNMLDQVSKYYTEGDLAYKNMPTESAPVGSTEFNNILNQAGINAKYAQDGKILSFSADKTFTTGEAIGNIGDAANSNNVISTVEGLGSETNVSIPVSTTVNATGSTTSKFLSALGVDGVTPLKFVTGSVLPAIAAAGTGIALGKTIDKLLYNTNPDFWDEHGMSTLNPDTWNSITYGDDSLNAKVFNAIFGLDPSDGNSAQMYLDENAVAYLTAYMNQKKVFDNSFSADTDSLKDIPEFDDYFKNVKDLKIVPTPTYFYADDKDYSVGALGPTWYLHWDSTAKTANYAYDSHNGGRQFGFISASKTPFKTASHINHSNIPDTFKYSDTDRTNIRTFNGKTFYSTGSRLYAGSSTTLYCPGGISTVNDMPHSVDRAIGYILAYCNIIPNNIKGINNQPSAKTPTITGTTPKDVLAELKEQYPELWKKAITEDVPQPDGSVIQRIYIPVGMPDISSVTDTQPTSGITTQENPKIRPATDPATEPVINPVLQTITNIISPPTTPTEPSDTGSGNTPVVVVPTGSANALYAIYNPTQAELNSFGAWLWSSNFVDQILKVFNNPMEAIIGLHKVFVTPIDGGSQNIKVGYLDSGVSSKIVKAQYVTKSCGTVNLPEYFGNVFDYSPFTTVDLYLPFVGIVRLDVADVMRSSISVNYHVDVLTGATLVDVRVFRDKVGGVIYQYTGSCAVQYPLSSGSYMGIVNGLVNAGFGVGSAIAGNPFGAFHAFNAVANMHTTVQRSGSFAGNPGAMGAKRPYLIISRPQAFTATDFEDYHGKPTNYTTTIEKCTGFIKAREIHLENISATDYELDELDKLLRQGILI